MHMGTSYHRHPKVKTYAVSTRTLLQLVCQVNLGFLIVAMAILSLAFLSGCSRRYHDMPVYSPIPLDDYDNYSVGRFKSSYLAEQIDHYYRGVNPGPLGVTTFVNLDDLYTTSSFGRMYAEQVMSELTMRGFDVIELRHSDALQILAESGEFALSRDVAAVKPERQLGGVIVGTYVVSPLRVYVNARLLDPTTSLVLSAASLEMDKTTEIAKLLRGGGISPTLERIPVRHIGISSYPMMWPNPYGRQYQIEERQNWTDTSLPPAALEPVEPKLEPSPLKGDVKGKEVKK